MRKIILFFLIMITLPIYSKTADSKIYKANIENTYVASIKAVKSLNFDIVELQANSGYILFKTKSNDSYLIMVSEIDKENTNVKISKMKNTSILAEIQSLFFNELDEKIKYAISRVDKWANTHFAL